MLLAALLSATDAAIVTDAGTYGTSNDLTTSQAVSTKVKEIVDLIDGTESGLAAAQIKFAEDGSLKDMASDVCNNKCDEGTTCFRMSELYPGATCFLTDYIDGASSITKDQSFIVQARSEWFRVAIQDGIPTQLAIAHMESAAAVNEWDEAAGILLGTDDDRGYTVYGRADGLARDYGTLSSESDHDNALHSKANEKIVTALETVRASSSGFTTQTANIIAQLKIIYAQAVLRSTWKVEEDLVAGTSHDKNQAQGLGYFGFIMLPYVKALDAKALDATHIKHADMIADFFDIGFSPESFDRKEYCRILNAMEDTLNDDTANLHADFGALTAAVAVTCPLTHLPGRLNLITDAGSYSPKSDIGGSLSYSTAMKKIVELTVEASTESQYARIKTAYHTMGLNAEALKNRTGEPVWEIFQAQTDSGTWVIDLLDSALDGTIAVVRSNDARRELVDKTAMDAASVQAVISDLYKATLKDPGTDPSVDRYWDHGAAKYIGTTTDRDSTIYARADERGANFEAVDDSNVAFTNIVILRALEVGRDATTVSQRRAQYDIIVKQIQVIYAQCALRYARLIDEALQYESKLENLPKYRAEGRAFWNIISPWIRNLSPDLTDIVTSKVFNLNVTPEKDVHAFCRVYEVVEKLHLPKWELGTLTAAAGVTCFGPKQTADTKPPTVPSPGRGGGDSSSKKHEELVGGLIGLFMGLFFACVFGCWACWKVRQERKGAVKLIQNASGRSVMVEMAGKPADDNALPYPDPNPSPSNV